MACTNLFCRSRRMRGFTLVELLVVIAIIGVLVALLLPAVQAAREAARRIQCTSNIKNVGLALLNYHSAFGEFPVAYLGPERADGSLIYNQVGGTQNSALTKNWMISLLPYLEQQPVYDSFVFKDPVSGGPMDMRDEVNRAGRSAQIASLLCPSDPNTSEPCSEFGGDWARGNYAINMVQSHNVFGYEEWDDVAGYGPRRGITFVNKSLSIAQITDGTSNTFMLLELRAGLNSIDPRGTWAMGMCASSTHCAHAVSWGERPNFCDPGATDLIINGNAVIKSMGAETLRAECMYPLNEGSGGGSSRRSTARSTHPGGIMVALADASARFISDFIDTGTYQSTNGPKYADIYRDQSKFRLWERLNVSNDEYPVGGDF